MRDKLDLSLVAVLPIARRWLLLLLLVPVAALVHSAPAVTSSLALLGLVGFDLCHACNNRFVS